MKNFPASPRYDAKHWASVEISLNMIGSLHVHIILQTIYVLKREILQFLGLKSTVYNQERVIMAHIRYYSIAVPQINMSFQCNRSLNMIYSKVYNSWDEVFYKIMKEPLLVKK